MLDQPDTRLERRRLSVHMNVRAMGGLVVILILSFGFGWYVLRFGPQSAFAHDRRGSVWSEKKEYAKAIAEHSEAIRLDPQCANAYCGRGFAWLEQKEYDKAIADYNEAIRLNPESPYTYLSRAAAWCWKLRYDKAVDDYGEFIRLYPIDTQAFGDLSESADDSTRSLASVLAHGFYGRGSAWLARQECDKALADYNEVIRLDPRLAAGYFCRGIIWEFKGEYDKALVDFGQAIRFDAEMASAYGSLAWIWSACPDPRLRDGKRAIESATKACELTKWSDGYPLESLAAAYAEAGEFDSAVKWQTKASATPTNFGENNEQRDRNLNYLQEQGASLKLYRQGQRDRLRLYQDKKPYRMLKP